MASAIVNDESSIGSKKLCSMYISRFNCSYLIRFDLSFFKASLHSDQTFTFASPSHLSLIPPSGLKLYGLAVTHGVVERVITAVAASYRGQAVALQR